MLKKKVTVESATGFDAEAASARVPMRERAERAPRGERRPATRTEATRAVHAAPSAGETLTRVRDRGEGHRDDGRSERDRQREAVYANNPDQPASTHVSKPAHAKAALMHGSGAHGHGTGRQKPIPALLMKRRAPEPENA